MLENHLDNLVQKLILVKGLKDVDEMIINVSATLPYVFSKGIQIPI